MKVLIVIPTHNEALVIEKNLRQVLTELPALLPMVDWQVLVADNGSTDRTGDIVQLLCREDARLGLWATDVKGRGNALRQVWQQADADIMMYMDADLATELRHIPELVEAMEQADVVVGSRFEETSHVQRSVLREGVSRVYRWIAHQLAPTSVKDLQCGFKAITKTVAQIIVPQTKHSGWFFDTELIALSEAAGYHVRELPVNWKEKRDVRRKSSVKLLSTAYDNIVQLWKLRRWLKEKSPVND